MTYLPHTIIDTSLKCKRGINSGMKIDVKCYVFIDEMIIKLQFIRPCFMFQV